MKFTEITIIDGTPILHLEHCNAKFDIHLEDITGVDALSIKLSSLSSICIELFKLPFQDTFREVTKQHSYISSIFMCKGAFTFHFSKYL